MTVTPGHDPSDGTLYGGPIAQNYSSRPAHYPPAMFECVAGLTPGRDQAVDLGAGPAHTANALARYYARVIATDVSADQRALALPALAINVDYRLVAAEVVEIPDNSVDLVFAGTSWHWFFHKLLHPRVVGMLKKPHGSEQGGVIWACAYIRPFFDHPAIDDQVTAFIDKTAPYGDPQSQHSKNHYKTLPDFPPQGCVEIGNLPEFCIIEERTLLALCRYLGTRSSVRAYQQKTGVDPVKPLYHELQPLWEDGGNPDYPRQAKWIIAVRAARIG